MQKELIKQLFRKAFTNRFPGKRIPEDTERMEREGINSPINVPEDYRGRISYDKEKCTGCQLCTRVCPSKAVVYHKEENKISYHLLRCTFCGECVEVCPVQALTFTQEFLLARTEKD